MDEELKKKLHYELVERRIKKRNDTATVWGIMDVLILFIALAMFVGSINGFVKQPITIGSFQSMIMMVGFAGFLGGGSILMGIAGVAGYFDTCKWIDELEKLYSEVLKCKEQK